MDELVGLTYTDLNAILLQDDAFVIRFCQDQGLLQKSYKCPVCHEFAVLKYGRGRKREGVSW